MDHASSEDIVTEVKGRAGLVTLTRSKAFNAVTWEMIGVLERFYHQCAKNPHIYGIVLEAKGKAFSAGGDLRALRDWAQSGAPEASRFYADEYQHNWTLECFKKRHVALINGIVMGGGVGISIYGTHRVAGESMIFAMPETGIGFFPDIGAGWFLPRMPGYIGMFLGLTGHRCATADAYYAGIATHCVPAALFGTVKEAVIEGEPIDTVLDSLHEDPGTGWLERHREPIDRIFSAPTLSALFERLSAEQAPWRDWVQETLGILKQKSPLALKVTFEQLKRGKSYKTLKEALIVEYRLAMRMLHEPDFLEGIRAAIVDKDQSPRWQPKALSEVSEAAVQSFFQPLPDGDLSLIDYFPLPKPQS
jgi:enoyl-CoA hydratase